MIRIFTHHKFFLFAYLLFVPLSCLSSVRFALSFQPLIDATLQRSSFFSVAFSCAFWGIADLLLLLLVRRLRFALLARTKASFKQQLCSSILSAPYQMFENKDCLSLLNNDTQAEEGFVEEMLEGIWWKLRMAVGIWSCWRQDGSRDLR